MDGKEVTIRSSADERLCINKAREEQTSKHMESNVSYIDVCAEYCEVFY